MTILAILQHTPTWVWALFAALIALGYSQTRDRDMTLLRVTALPLAMIVLSLSGVLGAFGVLPLPIGAWAAGVGISLAFGRALVVSRGARWLPEAGRVHVPGSWLPMALIVALFGIKYAAGVAMAMTPGLAHEAGFAAACALGYGLFSGLFLARGVGLRQLASTRSASVAGA